LTRSDLRIEELLKIEDGAGSNGLWTHWKNRGCPIRTSSIQTS
jgi:hypothetical protein